MNEGLERPLARRACWRSPLRTAAALAVVERAVVRVLGITTWAVHLVGFAPDGRSGSSSARFDKARRPWDCWDTLMGGQVGAGESIEETLERETQEEADLAIADLVDLRHTDRITCAPAGRQGLRHRARGGVRGDRPAAVPCPPIRTARSSASSA